MIAYRPRTVDPLIGTLLDEVPAILLVGPRATGKTTTATRHAATTIRLDRPAEAAAFRADPDAALRGLEEPVLLDEWQVVPEVLGAVKRTVDDDPRPGRYILTGSVRADIEAATWPGTGRLVRVPLFGMTVAEQHSQPNAEPLIERLRRGDELCCPVEGPDLRAYVELALRGGFPYATLSLSDRTRARWLASYVDQLVTRDADALEGPRDPAKLRRYFEAYALGSAGVVQDKTLFEAAGLNRKTAVAYEQLLANLMVIERIAPWLSQRLKRLVRSPKRYLTDPALFVGILGLDSNAVLRDGDLLGRVLDTFVAAQLRAEMPVTEPRIRLHHLRQEQGRHEIDLLAEYGAGKIIGVEVKADSAPDRDAARHLVWLRDRLGERFVRGVVFHTGPRVFELGDRIIAAPISVFWG